MVVGGVRRSALSLSDLGDEQMRLAKSGAWWEDSPTEHSQTTVPTTIPNPTQGHFLENGLPSTKVGVENVESTLRLMQENKLNDSLSESLEMTSGRIHVLK